MSEPSQSLFDLVFGLPLHIFVNHAVVVLLPLGALALVATVLIPRLRRHYALPSAGLVILGAIAAVIAEQSGEALEDRVGSAGQHGEWGETLVSVSLALAAGSVVWLLVSRWRSGVGKVLSVLSGIGVVGLSGAVIVLVVLAGHSGADLTWGGRVAAESSQSQQQDTAGESDREATPETAPENAVLTLELVATHASADSCWSVVDNTVYDLTEWIDQHPGGSSRILGLCGRDATADFTAQHGGEGSPQATLERYALGEIGDPAP